MTIRAVMSGRRRGAPDDLVGDCVVDVSQNQIDLVEAMCSRVVREANHI